MHVTLHEAVSHLVTPLEGVRAHTSHHSGIWRHCCRCSTSSRLSLVFGRRRRITTADLPLFSSGAFGRGQASVLCGGRPLVGVDDDRDYARTSCSASVASFWVARHFF